MDSDLAGRVAVVMGATRGIGRAIVHALAARGAAVWFQGRDAAAAEEVIASAPGAGPAPRFVAADFARYDDLQRVVATAADAGGRLDILVANGGDRSIAAEPFAATRPEGIPAFFTTRLFNKLGMIHAALPYMRAQRYGKIVATTSDAGRVPTPGESLVGASAAALIFLTRALGRELARDGIRVNAVSTSLTADTPGYDWYQRAAAADADAAVVKAFQRLEAKSPFGLNRPEDIAAMAVFLASPASDRISGAVVSVNGGLSFPG